METRTSMFQYKQHQYSSPINRRKRVLTQTKRHYGEGISKDILSKKETCERKLPKCKTDIEMAVMTPKDEPSTIKRLQTFESQQLCEEKMMAKTVEASMSQQSDVYFLDPRSKSAVFRCKSCLKNITSFRYRCLVCPDYEMCGECERRGGHHDDHYVLRVPMQRPTVEVDQVESAVRRALSLFPAWNQALKSIAEAKVGKKNRLKNTGNKQDKTRRDSGTDTLSDSEINTGSDTDTVTENDSGDTDDEPSDTEMETEITLREPNEPEVKAELDIKEELDPLDEEVAPSTLLRNSYESQTTCGSQDVPSNQLVPPSRLIPPFEGVPSSHIAKASQGVPTSYLVQLTQGIPPIQSVPPTKEVPRSKKRRDGDHNFTKTSQSHKPTLTMEETTEICTETSSSSRVATSSTSESKADGEGMAEPGPNSCRSTSSPTRKRLKKLPIHSTQKEAVINTYNRVEENWPKDTYPYKSDIANKTAEIMGISPSSVYKFIREKKTTGRLKSPSRLKPRKCFIDTLDDLDLSAIRRKVKMLKNEMPTVDRIMAAVNADDTLPNFRRTTFFRLLHKLELKFSKGSRKSKLANFTSKDD